MNKIKLLKPLASFIFLIPFIIYAQVNTSDIIGHNKEVLETFGLFGSASISPFFTLFLTSCASRMGFSNSLLQTNPLLGSDLVFFGSLFFSIITTFPNLLKMFRPLGLAGQVIEDWLVIILTFVLLTFSITEILGIEIVDRAYAVPLSGSFILVYLVAIPYYIIVSTVRFSADLLIFISPIPLVDAFYDGFKKFICFLLVCINLLMPYLGLFISAIIFFIAYLLYRKAKSKLYYNQYIFLNPAVKKLFGKQAPLLNEKVKMALSTQYKNIDLAIKILLNEAYGPFKKKSIVWLVKHENGLLLYQKRFMRSAKIVELSNDISSSLGLREELTHYSVIDGSLQINFLINATHKWCIKAIETHLDITFLGKSGIVMQLENMKQGCNIFNRGANNLLSRF